MSWISDIIKKIKCLFNKPSADFSATPTSGNAPLTVTFKDATSKSPTAWAWNFGDSGTSSVQNPSHSYTAVGNYSVSLNATNDCGSSSASVANYITVTGSPTPPPPPPPSSGFRGCLFTPGELHPTLPNNRGVRSQMDYRDCHGQSNEGQIRDAEYNDVATLGGNCLIYIQGKSNYSNPVLDMCLNSRTSPVDGHRFPIANPMTASSEVDTAAWYAKTLGVTRHLVWIFNDDNAVPFTRQTVKDGVDRYTNTLVDVWFGLCLETSEIASAADAAARLRDLREFAPTRPIVVGSCPVDFLLQVKAANAPSDTYYWLEQDASGNPLTDPLTMANVQAKMLNKATALVNAGVQPSRVIIGEWWATTADLRKQLTALFEGKGYLVGSGQWK